MARYSDEILREVFDLYFNQKKSKKCVSETMEIPYTSVWGIINSTKNRYKFADEFSYEVDKQEELFVDDNTDELGRDKEIIEMNVKLARNNQRLMDINRVHNKSFREFARSDTMILALQSEMVDILRSYKFSSYGYPAVSNVNDDPVGIIQLSDLHFNELIDDIAGNKFNMEVASKRIHKHIYKSANYFLANGVSNVALFLTGDLLNSDRRLDEIVNAATNRTKAMFVIVDVLQQAIQHLDVKFDTVTVASVAGNESRVREYVEWSSLLASDSYDVAVHNMLSWLFKDSETVNFLDIDDPFEKVVKVGCVNFLLVHGNAHKGISRTSNIENEVERIKARYASRNVKIDYVIMGHIHQAFVSDLFSRSSGLPGANSYSEKALNLNGKSSQNAYIVYPDGSIDGIKIDLQKYDEFSGFDFDRTLQSYHNSTEKQNTVVIQSVLI